MSENNKQNRGGRREGAGRPKAKIDRKTVCIRVTDEEKAQLKAYLAQLRDEGKTGKPAETIDDESFAAWEEYGNGRVMIFDNGQEPPEDVPVASMDRKRLVLELVKRRLSKANARMIYNNKAYTDELLRVVLQELIDITNEWLSMLTPKEAAKKMETREDWILTAIREDTFNVLHPNLYDNVEYMMEGYAIESEAVLRSMKASYTAFRMNYTSESWTRLWQNPEQELLYCYIFSSADRQTKKYLIASPDEEVTRYSAESMGMGHGSAFQCFLVIDRRQQIIYPAYKNQIKYV